MVNVRRWTPIDGDFIEFDIGTLDTIHEGAFTIAGLVRKEADGGFFPLCNFETVASARRGVWTTSADNLMAHMGGFNVQSSVTLEVADDWAVVGIGKDAGEELIRVHRGIQGGAWTHADGDEGFDDTPTAQELIRLIVGSVIFGDVWAGLIAVVGIWQGTNLADADFTTNDLRDSLENWEALNPDALLVFNQASPSDAVPDVMGNITQTGRSGTTVVDDGDLVFDFGGAEEIEIAPTILELQPQPFTLDPGEVSINLPTTLLDLVPQPFTLVPGVVTITLPTFLLDFIPQSVQALAGESFIATPSILELEPQPFTLVPGVVTISLPTFLLDLIPIDIGQIGAEVDISVIVGATRTGTVDIGEEDSTGILVLATREARGD